MRGRKTGGRHKGTPNRKTAAQRRAELEAILAGIQPLQYMLSVMRCPDVDADRRDRMAIACATYVHPRLSAIAVNAPNDGEELRLTLATAEALRAKIRGVIHEGKLPELPAPVVSSPASDAEVVISRLMADARLEEPTPEPPVAAHVPRNGEGGPHGALVPKAPRARPEAAQGALFPRLPGSGNVTGYRERDPLMDLRAGDLEPES
jgi:hypothetical protein